MSAPVQNPYADLPPYENICSSHPNGNGHQHQSHYIPPVITTQHDSNSPPPAQLDQQQQQHQGFAPHHQQEQYNYQYSSHLEPPLQPQPVASHQVSSSYHQQPVSSEQPHHVNQQHKHQGFAPRQQDQITRKALCSKCSEPYPLPSGASTWRCKRCTQFNSINGGNECVML